MKVPRLLCGPFYARVGKIILAVKGRIIIFIGVVLTACVIAFHIHQINSAAKTTDSQLSSSAVAPRDVAKMNSQLTVVSTLKNRNSNSIAPQTVAVQAATNGDTNVTSELDPHFVLMAWLRGLAATNLTAALEYISKMPEGTERDDAVQAVCYGVAQKDPAQAIATARELQVSTSVSDNIVQQWAGSDMKSALAWVATQPAGEDRDEMVHRIVLVLAPSDPSDAAGLVLEQIPPGSAQDEAVMTVLNQWAYKDFAAAVRWVENFPDGPLRTRAVAELEGIHQYQHDLAKSSN